MNKKLILAMAGAGALFVAEKASAEDAKKGVDTWDANVTAGAGYHTRQHAFGMIFTDHPALSVNATAGFGPFSVGAETFMWDQGLYEVDTVLNVGGPVGPFDLSLTGIYAALPQAQNMEPRGLGVLIGDVGLEIVGLKMVWDLHDGLYGQLSFDPTMPVGNALTLGLHSEFAFNAGCLVDEGYTGGHVGVGAGASVDLLPNAEHMDVSLDLSLGAYSGWLGDRTWNDEEYDQGWFTEGFADLGVTVKVK